MKLLSTPDELFAEIDRLVTQCTRDDKIKLVTAWATPGRGLDRILRDRGPTIEAIVGISMAVTHPNALRQLDQYGYLRIAREQSSGLFHPKLFLFEYADHATLVTGSPNLTGAAFSCNTEVAISLDIDAAKASEVCRLFKRLWDKSTPFETFDIDEYETRFNRASSRSRLRDAESTTEAPAASSSNSLASGPMWGEFFEADWPTLVDMLRSRLDAQPGLDSSFLDGQTTSYLATIRAVRPLLRSTFSSLNDIERRMLLGDTIKHDGRTVDYGPLGNLWSAREGFEGLRHPHTSSAHAAISVIDTLSTNSLDGIDVPNALSRGEQFFTTLTAIHGYKAAFATRFLALARPDVFFSLNSKSVGGIKLLFRLDPTESWDAYLKCVSRLHAAKWYQPPRPSTSPDDELWDARIAILDAYVYVPDADDA